MKFAPDDADVLVGADVDVDADVVGGGCLW